MSVSPELTRAPAAPPFPPALLAFLGLVFLVAPGDPSRVGSRVGLSLGLLLAALVWVAVLRVVERQGA